PIVSSRKSANYTDVYTLANPSSNATNLLDAWLGWAHVRISIDEVGRRERRSIIPERAASSLMIVIAAALIARVLWLLAARFGAPELRSRGLRVLVPVLAAALAAIAVTTLSLRPWVSGAPGRWPPTPPAMAPTGLTLAHLQSLAGAPGGEAQLASALLAAADADETALNPAPPATAAEPVLVYGWSTARQMEQSVATGGWPQGLLVSRLGPAGAAQPDGRWALSIDRNAIIIRRFGATDPAVRSQWSYSLAALSKVAVALLLIWYTTAAALALWRRLLRRRDRRRTRAGRCIPCGYDLRSACPATQNPPPRHAPPPPLDPPTSGRTLEAAGQVAQL